jgi:hypothetical protein
MKMHSLRYWGFAGRAFNWISISGNIRTAPKMCARAQPIRSRTRLKTLADWQQDGEHGASHLGRVPPVRHLARDLLQPLDRLADLRFAEHAFFQQEVDKTFAEHQCGLTLRITGTHSHTRREDLWHTAILPRKSWADIQPD